MNAGLNPRLWLELLLSLGLQASLIFILAWSLQRLAQTGWWRRTIWQVVLLGLGLMAVLELTGVSRATASWASDWRWLREQRSPARNSLATKRVAQPAPPSASAGTYHQPRSIRREPDLISSRFGMIRLTPDATAEGEGARAVVEAAEDQNARFGWWPGMVWLAGFGFVVGRAGLSHLLFLIFRRRKQFDADAAISERIRSLARLLGMGRRVRVTYLNWLTGPVAFGVFRPTISLPEGFCQQFTSEQREAMLIHELAHLAARDPLWYLLAEMVTALLWWHPLVWWARRQFHTASEAAADEASLLIENGPAALAECLVELGRRLALPRSFGWLGIEGNGFRSGLGRRVVRLCELSGRSWRREDGASSWVAKVAGPAVLAAAGIAGAAWALPQQDGGDSKSIAQGWERSVARLALDEIRSGNKPTADEPKPLIGLSPASIAALIADAKLFLEADKLDQAEGLLDEVLKIDPTNQPAANALNSIQEKRKAKAAQFLPKAEFTNTPLTQFQPFLTTAQTQRGEGSIAHAQATTAPGKPLSGDPKPEVRTNGAQTAEGQEQPAGLHTRIFHVDPNTLTQGLKGVTRLHSGTNSDVKLTPLDDYPTGSHIGGTGISINQELAAAGLSNFFQQAGIKLDPPKAVFFNERSGLMMVRATIEDLETIEKAIQLLNMSPPQVTIEVRVGEMREDDNSWVGIDWPASISNSEPSTSSGILTDPQFRTVLTALQQRSGVNLLTTPKVTTLSGRQAQIKVVDVKYIVTDLNINISTNYTQGATGGIISSAIQPITEPIELGPIIDVVPYVSADEFTIQLKVTASLKEFLGYDRSEGFEATVRETDGKNRVKTPLSTSTPLPMFRVRQVSASAVVWDGQTLVLSAGSFYQTAKTKSKVPVLGDLPLAGRLFRNETSTMTKKRLLIFVTPTVIDPAGNRVHSAEEMSSAAKATPTQSAVPAKVNAQPANPNVKGTKAHE